MRRVVARALVALALVARCARAFSGGAGACAHASVGHGTARATPRRDDDVVVRVGEVARGATVAVEIRARAPFRGFLLRARDGDGGEALGEFDARAMPRGTRVKSDCGSNAFATHDGSTGATTSVVVPWLAPRDAFDSVRFEATVVEDYSTWYAVERDAKRGFGGDVDDDAARRLREAREASASDGARAPSVDAALAGGWRAPRANGADARAETARARRLGAARLAHGSLMGLAWLILSPGASLAARYGRRFDPWWFRAHRAAQSAAVALSVVAACVIVAARGWSKPWGPHGRRGAAVVALASAQACAGYVRKSLPRADFRKWHRGVGIVTTVIATYNCVTGASMLARLESSDATSAGAPRSVALCVFATAACAALCEAQRRRAVRRLMGKSSKSMV